jgi:hypothetical protein
VTASGAPQKPSNSSEVRDTGSASDAERSEGASGGGGFNVQGGWAGVRESVDRTSVVDGGCRGRDSRRRRPSKRERVTARSVRPKIDRLPRRPALPLAPASAAARQTYAFLRTDYRKMEQDRDGNGVLPRKLRHDNFQRRRRPQTERDGLLWIISSRWKFTFYFISRMGSCWEPCLKCRG